MGAPHLHADDGGLPDQRKKLLTGALEDWATGAPVAHPALRRLQLAQIANKLHGGPVVSMWDVENLDGATEDLLISVAFRLPALRQRNEENEAARIAWLSRHRQYGSFGLLSQRRNG